jgi:hypothetical protein
MRVGGELPSGPLTAQGIEPLNELNLRNNFSIEQVEKLAKWLSTRLTPWWRLGWRGICGISARISSGEKTRRTFCKAMLFKSWSLLICFEIRRFSCENRQTNVQLNQPSLNLRPPVDHPGNGTPPVMTWIT